MRLLFDAEQQAVQHGIDDWTLHYMRKYNKPSSTSSSSSSFSTPPARAVIYGTYQAYLKATPSVLASHLRAAQEEGFTLGVKLVRGAYLGADPRELIHDTKEDTDACYNGIAEALLRRTWTGPLAPQQFAAETKKNVKEAASGGDGGGGDPSPSLFPAVNMVLASHNAETVRKARAILAEGGGGGGGGIKTEIAFAQLQGMADEVSCEILAAAASASASAAGSNGLGSTEGAFRPRAYKYLVWGSTGECMKYLLRRAQENRDAVQRTKSGRDAMRAEVWRRCKGLFGLA